jgi:hypothetical protein
MAEPWRGVSNSILFDVLFDTDLDDDAVDRTAQRVIEQPFLSTSEEEYARIAEALRCHASLTGSLPTNPHGEQEYRDFLERVLDRLDELRPWPVQPYVAIDVPRWQQLDGAQLVARIHLGHMKIAARIYRAFRQAAGYGGRILVLRLKSGSEVAMVYPWWPDSPDVALLVRDPYQAPPQVVAEFRAATGLTEDEVTLLPPGDAPPGPPAAGYRTP